MKRAMYLSVSISFLLFGFMLNSHAQTDFTQYLASSVSQANHDAANLNFVSVTAHNELDLSEIYNANCSECCCKLGMSTWCTTKDICTSGSMAGKCVKDSQCKD